MGLFLKAANRHRGVLDATVSFDDPGADDHGFWNLVGILDLLLQEVEGPFAHDLRVDVDRCQRRVGVFGNCHVVEADDVDTTRDGDVVLLQGLQRPDRHGVTADDEGVW